MLCLSDNPVASLPEYRKIVLHHVPGLAKLDTDDVTEAALGTPDGVIPPGERGAIS